MHLGFCVSLADYQRRVFQEQFSMSLVEFTERHGSSVPGGSCRAHYAQTLISIQYYRLLTVLALDQVATIAEKDESTLHQPSEEVADFHQFPFLCRFLANLQCARRHRAEIGSSRGHLGENLVHIG